MLTLAPLLIAFAFAADKPVADKKTITWVYTASSPAISLPKSNIVDDRHPLVKLYHDQLSEYSHHSFSATIPRIEMELKSKRLVCYPGSSEASRRKEFTYLTSQYIQPAPHLVIKKDLAARLSQQHKNGVSLKEVLRDKTLRGLVGEGRSYGNIIDSLITENEPNNLKKGVFETFGPGPLNMIEKGRADYTIEYPFILHNLRQSQLIGKELVDVPLVDVGHSLTQYLACTRTPDGLAVIKRADKIIRDNIKSPQYWTGVLQSMPEADRPAFQKEIDKFIESRAKQPVIIE